MEKGIDVGLNVNLVGIQEGDKVPQLFAYAFDTNGSFVERQAIENNSARFSFPTQFSGKSVRVLVAPAIEEKTPVFADLKRLGAYETRFSLRDRLGAVDLNLSPIQWRPLLWCICHITGQVVKKVTLPDGTTKNLPICHARVKICEIDRLPILIQKLPDDLLWKLRDDILRVPPFPPEPPEEIIGPLGPLVVNPIAPVARLASARSISKLADPGHACESCQKTAAADVVQTRALALTAVQDELTLLRPLAAVTSADNLRARLVEFIPQWIHKLCWFHWLEPFFLYHKHCFSTVLTDDNGRFSKVIIYRCSDKPDLYFSVDQWQGSSWESIYHPSLRCGTHWNYDCNSEITLVVTDPAAIPCSPQDPVTPPFGVGTWVMPYMVGGTPIFGNPSGPVTVPAGWVKPDGYTDYSSGSLGLLQNAPFGSTLGFRLGYSYNIPSSALMYYRFSYSRAGADDWTDMSTAVGRHYVHEVPGQLPTFPVYQLGPNTVGTEGNLFEFKPDNPPAPEPTDPPGTITYWPEDDWFGDIYSAFLDTTILPLGVLAAAGQYDIRVEIFNSAGELVPEGTVFDFIVPKTVTNDGVTTRNAKVAEIINNAFVFKLQIDNNPSTGAIDAPAISTTSVADDCGFLRYQNTSDLVTLAFHAQHPNNQAVFSLGVVRGALGVGAASVAGHPQVGTSPVAVQDGIAAHAYTGDSLGNYAQAYAAAVLLDGCVNAAYAISLGVYGKATNGWGRIGYDDSKLRAFALAQS